jgi:hypothetical protein
MGIENEFIEFKARVEAILPTLATKADLEAMRAEFTRWMLGTVVGLFLSFSGLVVALTRTPTAAPAPPPARAACQPCPPQPAAPQEKSPR